MMGSSLRLLTVLACAAPCGCMAAPPEATPIGKVASAHVSYTTGYKRLSSGWTPKRDQWVFGAFDADWRPSGWPLWISAQMLLSYADGAPDFAPFYADYNGTYELSLGLRRYTVVGRCEPWIGAGLDLLGGSVSESYYAGGWGWGDTLDDDLVLGWYADGGVQVPLSPLVTLGLAVRWSDGPDLDLFGQSLDSSSLSVLAMIGTRL